MNHEHLKNKDSLCPLPASLVALAFAASQTWFFMNRSGNDPAAQAASISATLAYTGCFLMMLRSRRPAFWRRIFFVTIALVFFPAFIGNLLDHRGSMSLDQTTVANADTPFCHIAFTMTLIPQLLQAGFIFPARMTQGYASVFSMLLIWLLASLTLGRGWCAWVCFYGGWDDAFSRLARKPRLNLDKSPLPLRLFPFAMLGFVVLGSMASLVAVYCEWLCPFKMVTEYAAITGFASWLATIMFIVAFVGLVVVLPLLSRKRVQCATFCPFGALQSLLDRLSPFRIRIDTDTCTACQACVRACPTLSISPSIIQERSGGPGITCTKCGDCIELCPQNAIRLDFRHTRGQGPSPVLKEPGTGLSAPSPHQPGRLAAGFPLQSLVRNLCQSLKALLSPRVIFVTSAYTLGMIVSSGFAQNTLTRLINLFFHGQFSLAVLAAASAGGLP